MLLTKAVTFTSAVRNFAHAQSSLGASLSCSIFPPSVAPDPFLLAPTFHNVAYSAGPLSPLLTSGSSWPFKNQEGVTLELNPNGNERESEDTEELLG